jgi:phosphate transport system permease protein
VNAVIDAASPPAPPRTAYRALLRRKLVDRGMRALAGLAVGIAMVPLVSVLWQVLRLGLPQLRLSFFTSLPVPVGELGGGMGNALVGTLVLCALGSAIGIPIGVLAGIYLSEFGRGRLAKVVRFMADVLSGVPSIVVGMFAYAVVVVPTNHFSALAGGVALSVLMIPVVTRTTEEMLRLVPTTLREAALALGAPRWRATLSIVLPTALPGVLAGVMLAVARVAGETAPLLFTAFGSRFWLEGLNKPVAALPLQIFTYAVSPYDDWHAQAWTGALVLVLLVVVLQIAVRLYAWRRAR